MFGEVEFSHVLVSDFDAGRISPRIELCVNRQPSGDSRMGPQIHNDAIVA